MVTAILVLVKVELYSNRTQHVFLYWETKFQMGWRGFPDAGRCQKNQGYGATMVW